MSLSTPFSSSSLALAGGTPIAPAGSFPLDRTEASSDAREALLRTLDSGCWSMFTSPEVGFFEQELATYVGARHTVFVNSCTTAIHAALLAHDTSPGSRVAVPAYTYVGTCLPVVAAGATPVFIDIDLTRQSMDVEDLEKEFERRPIHAVIQAHLFGKASGAEAISALCEKYGAAYISDCAQLIGNREITSLLCELGTCCFSFGESKVLRIGEGGAIATNSDAVAEKLRLARHEGEVWLTHNRSRITGWSPTPKDVLYDLASTRIGLNYRPPAILASLGRIKLRELHLMLDRTRKNAEFLLQSLSHVDNIMLSSSENRIWWTFPIVLKHSPLDRDTVLAALLAEGIPAGVHFPKLMNRHPVLHDKGGNSDSSFPRAEYFSENHLVLPIYPSLSIEHMKLIANGVKKIMTQTWPNAQALKQLGKDFLESSYIAELCSGLFMFLQR